MPIALKRPKSKPKAGTSSAPHSTSDVAALVDELKHDVYVIATDDAILTIVSALEHDHQRLWLHMVEARVPAARGLADRLLAMLRHVGISVIRLTEPVRLAMVRDARDDEIQIDALVQAKLVAVHVRHFLASEIVLLLSKGPSDSMP